MIHIDLNYGEFETSGDVDDLLEEYKAITSRLMHRMHVIGFEKEHIYSVFRTENIESLALMFPEQEGD